MKTNQRLVINTKDVMNITGRKDRAAREMLLKIKRINNKQKREFVSVEEFCRYTGLPINHVISALN